MTKSGIINPKSETTNNISEDDQSESLRRGPWTLEEDNLLIQYVSCHGDGRWNSLAKYAGLKRTGKSCRLRWLNYLNPDIKRGNFTPHEQLLILELHSKWGNRWSKIAKHLPGRTDNEIKNYWRTRVQKQARQLQVDSNSRKFLEAARMFWTPRLVEPSISSSSPSPASSSISTMDQALCHTKLPCPNSNYNNTTSAKEITNIQQLPPADADTLGNSKVIQCDENPNEGSIHNFYEEDVRVKRLMEAQESSFYGCHLEEDDWLGEELGNGFWNYSDELWQFKRAEEIIGV